MGWTYWFNRNILPIPKWGVKNNSITFKAEAITSYLWDEVGGKERTRPPIMSGVLGPLALGFLQLLGLGELYKDSYWGTIYLSTILVT